VGFLRFGRRPSEHSRQTPNTPAYAFVNTLK